jgi:DNA-binding Lrp family transcriptional regulator
MQLAYLTMKAKMGKLKLVTAALQELKEIVEFHEVYGRYDIFALVEVEDLEALKNFIQNKIMIITGLSYCETFIARD